MKVFVNFEKICCTVFVKNFCLMYSSFQQEAPGGVTGTATESTIGLVFLLENGRDRTEAVKLSIAHCSQLPNQTRLGWETCDIGMKNWELY